MGTKKSHETEKFQVKIEDEQENVQENLAVDESSENEIEEPFGESGDLLKDAMAAAQVIEDSKKEEAKPKEDIKPKEEAKKADYDLERKYNALKNEFESKDNQLKRMAADFDNFRRRQTQDKEDFLKFAGEKIILDILPVLDNLERAISHAKDSTDAQSLLSGIELVQKQLIDAIAKNGVSPIEALDNIFDPNFHEAVQQLVNDDKPDQTVINELQKGYTLNGRVIRPSMVVVSTTSD